MMALFHFILIAICCYVSLSTAAVTGPKATTESKKVVCYYTFWSHSRKAPYGLTPDKIDPFLCTHLIYAFADLGERNNIISSDPHYDFDQRAYANITGLKKQNKDLKVMLSVGGWTGGTKGFARITASDKSRKEFAKNAVRFIRGYLFDGLDLNWQHPTFREGGTPQDKENYVLLAQSLREEFDREAESSGKPKLQLSIAISHHSKFLPAYDIANFNKYVDFITVICYDYHFSYESAVNHHAPLYSLEEDTDYNYDAKINTNYTIHYFLEFADPEKLVLGIPTYGRTYKLENPEDTSLGSYADGAGDRGPVTGEKGFFAYFEICNLIKNENWTVVQTKPGAVGPYAYKGNQWVGYDDIQMTKNKAAYANEKGLGGVMFWTIDYDDFLGSCHGTKFPLIKAARNEFFDVMIYPEDSPENPRLFSTTPARDPVQAKSPPARRSPSYMESRYLHRPCDGPPDHYYNHRPVPPRSRPPPPQMYSPRPPPWMDSRPYYDYDYERETSVIEDLVRLIEKAGGVNNLCNIFRKFKNDNSDVSQTRNKVKKGDTDNSIVLETPNLPPIQIILNNSSVYINELNIFGKTES